MPFRRHLDKNGSKGLTILDMFQLHPESDGSQTLRGTLYLLDVFIQCKRKGFFAFGHFNSPVLSTNLYRPIFYFKVFSKLIVLLKVVIKTIIEYFINVFIFIIFFPCSAAMVKNIIFLNMCRATKSSDTCENND